MISVNCRDAETTTMEVSILDVQSVFARDSDAQVDFCSRGKCDGINFYVSTYMLLGSHLEKRQESGCGIYVLALRATTNSAESLPPLCIDCR